MDDIRWLFVGTAIVTLAVNPAFGWLVSRFRRITFITLTYALFAVSLVGFYALLVLAPRAIGEISGMVFYVWFSVLNLFCTMVFWALMVDRFTLDQSKRLFGAIAVGGTLGAIAGPWLAGALAKPLGTPALLLIAAGFLLLSVLAAWGLVWLESDHDRTEPIGGREGASPRDILGGSAWHGVTAVFRSPYLLGISAYMLVLSVIATFIYFTRLQMVKDLGGDTDSRAVTLAQIDLATQAATLVLQVVATGHIMRRFGVSVALASLPVLMALGFLSLAMIGSLWVLVALDVIFKAIQRAVMRPARETLFTVVSREDKYKSKAITDTFVYRGGDVLGAGIEGAISRLAGVQGAVTQLALIGLGTVAVPITIVWAILGWWLGRHQQRLASGSSRFDEQTAPNLPRLVSEQA
ncbi:MAG: MFS transporter [Phycisphaerales bacterium]|nr:MFS transporter [Phycisphaerales bacterium]